MTLKDCYDMGRYVARHMGTMGALDRIALTQALDGRQCTAFFMGRDRNWRLGMY